MSPKYRSDPMHQSVIAFSVSHQRDNPEHIRELLIRLARPILRQGASLAYGGNWKETDDNFTYDLLRLISAEQEDNSVGGPDTSLAIGILYNHSPWPNYLDVSPSIEAQWINACRIVRITQKQAGIRDSDIASDDELKSQTNRAIFNAAVTLSAMRRLMMTPITIPVPSPLKQDVIPAVTARIMLGGKVSGFAGFLPGLFEEALATLENKRSLYLLGGFGGAAEVIANAIVPGTSDRPEEFTAAWLSAHNKALEKLLEISKSFVMPPGVSPTQKSLDVLFDFLVRARAKPSAVLNTGLSDEETRELLKTQDVSTAVSLVRKGLVKLGKLPPLAA
jgi:hypothetical protein